MKFSKKFIFLTFIIIGLYQLITRSELWGNYRAYKTIKDFALNKSDSSLILKFSNGVKDQFKNATFPYNYKRRSDKTKLIIITYSRGLGDQFTALRTYEAAINLGWEAVILGRAKTKNKLKDHIISFLKPDFVISQYHTGLVSGIPHYLVMHQFDENIEEKILKGEKIKQFDNMLMYKGVLASAGDDRFVEPINSFFSRNNKKLNYIPYYLSVSEKNNEFRELKYSKLFFCGDKWDPLRSGEKYNKLYKLLDAENYLDIYGPEKAWRDYPNSYKGFLPFETETFLNAMRKSGIALVLHSNSHFKNNLPSSRIFESAAASSVIISDKLPFIMSEFGDNVLYIDSTKPAAEIFTEINNHIKWINNHPNDAREKARNCNRIFREKFTLEQQLLRLDNYNQTIK